MKSEVGLAWGGKTIWVLQDKLVDYISSSTALDVRQFLADKTDEVNLLSFSYGESYQQPRGLLELEGGHLFSGPISVNDSQSPSFQDMLRTPVAPPRSVLLRSLLNRPPTRSIVVP